MDHKLLSIILVSKNNNLDVKYTLDSLYGIEKLNYEILVIDSSDNLLTKNLLAEYKHFSNIEYFWTQPKGIYNAMNIGLKMSTENSYIWFLNPGDILINMECIYQVIENFSKLNVDYCITQAVYANKPRINDNLFPRIGVEISIENFIFGSLSFSHQATFVDSKVFKNGIKFDESYEITADYKLQYMLIKYFKGVLIPKLAVEIDVNGISHKKIIKTSFETASILFQVGYFSKLGASKYFVHKFFLRLFNVLKIRVQRLIR